MLSRQSYGRNLELRNTFLSCFPAFQIHQYQETKHLPTREALPEILRQAHEAAVAHGFVKKTPAVLAETPPPYGGKKQ
jgi:hypothetical protein